MSILKFFFSMVIQWRFVKRIEKQMTNFMKGFNEIVPQRCISIFDPKESEVFFCHMLFFFAHFYINIIVFLATSKWFR